MLRIITREAKSKFQLTIGVFSIAFVISVIEKLTEFLNKLTMKYELQNKCRINTVVIRVRNRANPCVRDMPKFIRTSQMSVHGYPADKSIFLLQLLS